MPTFQQLLQELGIPAGDLHDRPSSGKSFADGAQYRLEIAGIESAAALEAMVEEAQARHVPIHRVIGMVGGATLLTKGQLRDFARVAHDARLEVIVNPGPSRSWEPSRQVATSEGTLSGLRVRGSDNLFYLVSDVLRCVEAGLRGFLVLDEGVLMVLNHLRARGFLPPETRFKVSVFAGHGNAAGIKLLEQLGADSANPLSDLTVPMLAAIRQAVSIPLDVYVSIVDAMGGVNRFWEAAELVRVSSPCYLKLEPGPSEAAIYKPWVSEEYHIQMAREKVRLAQLVQEYIAELNPELRASPAGGDDLAIPRP